MTKNKILFVCIHNSARSQMAEELLRKYGGSEIFEVLSAGLEPGELNPLVVELLKKDEDIDISSKKTNSVFEFFKEGRLFNFIITVCDEASAQKCPIFPGINYRINWSFEDPSTLSGSDEEKMEKLKVIKEQIKNEVIKFSKLVKSGELKDNFPQNWKKG